MNRSEAFVDRLEVELAAGRGGDGLTSFRRDRLKAKGGPDGGNGGRGGSIIFVTDHNLNTLSPLRRSKQIQAADGAAGKPNRQHGRAGEDMMVSVPVGTVVSEGERILADLAELGQQAVVARGGRGGFGNAHFVSATRQAPKTAELGEPGERHRVQLELKLVADVGLVGLPNAGKSTFLAAVSNAKPAIADYPFTTLTPNLGVVDVDDASLLVADIPGLIEGASQGKGLGDEFLRHIERTAVLIHLVDINNPDVVQAYETIQRELGDYEIDLSQKPQLVALTKIETKSDEEVAAAQEQLEDTVGAKVWAMSAVAQRGLLPLLRAVAARVAQERERRAAEPEQLPVIELEAAPDSWQIERADDRFVVSGQKIERFAIQTDFNNQESVHRLRDIIQKMGILKELESQGLQPGSIITIGSKDIEW